MALLQPPARRLRQKTRASGGAGAGPCDRGDALAAPARAVMRRLRSKTRVAGQEAVGPLDLEQELGAPAHRQVYLVTLPHPKQTHSADGIPLAAPGAFSKQQILERFLACLREPARSDGRHLAAPGPGVPVLRTGVWRELHKQHADGSTVRAHDHLPILAQKQFRYLPVKRALLQRFGLASHWSCSHTGYWSAVRYLARPSPKKPLRGLDGTPVLWAASGMHPPVDECCHEPLTAAALRKRRLDADNEAAELGKRVPKITELDVWPIVVQHGFRNTADDEHAHLELIAFAKTHCSDAMHRFLFKHRQRLPALIDDIWRWETVEETLAKARMARLRLLEEAAQTPCRCQGEWRSTVTDAFTKNNIAVEDVCRDVYSALDEGRAERTPVIVFSGARGGEGKSFYFKPLYTCFGFEYLFTTPQKGNFPLLDLPGKKAVFLDDWRFDATVLPYATQCLWFDGSAFPIAQPQNQPGRLGHCLYRGTAPIFATTTEDDMERLRADATADPRTGRPRDANASMVLRRLKVYHFTQQLQKPQRSIPYCAHCFAELVLAQRQ